MTPDEFCRWTGYSKNKIMTVGEKITLPKQAAVPAHKGIYALATSYGMDLDRFCALNGIDKNYQPKVGETFYVFQGLKNGPAGNPVPPSNPTAPANNTTPAGTIGTNSGFKSVQRPRAGYWSVGEKENRSVRVLAGNPTAVSSGGKIVSETIKFEPYKSNTGELKGKVIMVNAGHGMKYQDTPQLDRGKLDAVDANGRRIEEWRKNRDYADILIKNLRSKGATVIFTNGDAKSACNEKRKYSCDLFISLHCNASVKKELSGLEIFHHEGDTTSKDLATKVATSYGLSNRAVKSDKETRHGVLGVLTNIGPKKCPSILLEMGYLTNETDIKNIDSIADRQKKMDKLTQIIVNNKDIL